MPVDPRKLYDALYKRAAAGFSNDMPSYNTTTTDTTTNPEYPSNSPSGTAPHGDTGTVNPNYSGTAADFYNALIGRLGETEFFSTGGPNRPQLSLFEQNKDRLINSIIPAMMNSGWSNNMPAFMSNNPWYGGYLLASALTGTPYYNPDADANTGVLQYIPGYAPSGAASTLAKGTHGVGPYYWMG